LRPFGSELPGVVVARVSVFLKALTAQLRIALVSRRHRGISAHNFLALCLLVAGCVGVPCESVAQDSTPASYSDQLILGLDYPRELLSGNNSDLATRVAYAETLYRFSNVSKPNIDEVFRYFETTRDGFGKTSPAEKWEIIGAGVVGLGALATGVGELAAGELAALPLLEASANVTAGAYGVGTSASQYLRFSEAEQDKAIADVVKHNTLNILITGARNPAVQEPLAAYLLTGIKNPTTAQVRDAYNSHYATRREVREAQQGAFPMVIDAARAAVREQRAANRTQTMDPEKLRRETMPSMTKAVSKAAEVQKTFASLRAGVPLDQASKQRAWEDVQYITLTLRNVGTIFHMSAEDQVQLNKALALTQNSAGLALELASSSTNPLAAVALSSNIMAILFGPDTAGPNPFKAIVEQIELLRRDVQQLQVDIVNFRLDVDQRLDELKAAVVELDRQVLINRRVMVQDFDTVLNALQSVAANKELDDWNEFEATLDNYRKEFPYAEDTEGQTVRRLREDNLRVRFARLVGHVTPGLGGVGHQYNAGDSNCYRNLLDEILRPENESGNGGAAVKHRVEQRHILLDRAAGSIVDAMLSPGYYISAQAMPQSYCVAGIAREIIAALPQNLEFGLARQYGAILPAEVGKDNKVQTWKDEQFVPASPLQVYFFLMRIRLDLASIPRPGLRAELAYRLLETVTPVMKSFGLTNGPFSHTLLAYGYVGLATSLHKDLNELLYNDYFKSVEPLGKRIESVHRIFRSTKEMHEQLYPVPNSQDVGDGLNSLPSSIRPHPELWLRGYDQAKLTSDEETREWFQRAMFVIRDENIERTLELFLQGLVEARNAAWHMSLPQITNDKMKWNPTPPQIEEVDGDMQRQIITSKFPSAAKEMATDADSTTRPVAPPQVIAYTNEKIYSDLFEELKKTFNCLLYVYPESVYYPSEAEKKYTPPAVNEIPESCAKDLHLSGEKWKDFSANYVTIVSHVWATINNAFPALDAGLNDYLRSQKNLGPDVNAVGSLETRIVSKMLAMRVIELLNPLDANSKVSITNVDDKMRSMRTTQNSAQSKLFNRVQTVAPLVDGILAQTASASKTSMPADGPHYIAEIFVPRPRPSSNELPSKISLEVYKRTQFEGGHSYQATKRDDIINQVVDLSATLDPTSTPSYYEWSAGSSDQDLRHQFDPDTAIFIANQGVLGAAEQYEMLRYLMGESCIEEVRDNLKQQSMPPASLCSAPVRTQAATR
jgi:hypothetical protein